MSGDAPWGGDFVPPEWASDGADLDSPADLWPSGTPDAAPPRRWVWDAMEPPERAERLVELARWVDWLRDTHELHRDIPACWYRHRPLVERLTALYAGWARTYIAPSQGRDHAELDWLHALDAMVPHLKRAGCAGGHTPPAPGRRRDQDAEAADFKQFLGEDWPVTAPVAHPAEAEVAQLDPPL